MDPIDVFKQQAADFEKYLPTWKSEVSGSFIDEYGEIVSAAVSPAIPDGVMVMLASKTHALGPILLTQLAAENLARLIAGMAQNRRVFGG